MKILKVISQLYRDNPTIQLTLSILLVLLALFVLPFLILINASSNINTLVILSNKDDYTRQQYYITEYRYSQTTDIEGSEFSAFSRYFIGTINGKKESWQDFRYINLCPQLINFFKNTNTQRLGVYELKETIDIWYNPNMENSSLTFISHKKILPYTPDFFASLKGELKSYAYLWLLFLFVWLTLFLMSVINKSKMKKMPKYNRKSPVKRNRYTKKNARKRS